MQTAFNYCIQRELKRKIYNNGRIAFLFNKLFSARARVCVSVCTVLLCFWVQWKHDAAIIEHVKLNERNWRQNKGKKYIER